MASVLSRMIGRVKEDAATAKQCAAATDEAKRLSSQKQELSSRLADIYFTVGKQAYNARQCPDKALQRAIEAAGTSKAEAKKHLEAAVQAVQAKEAALKAGQQQYTDRLNQIAAEHGKKSDQYQSAVSEWASARKALESDLKAAKEAHSQATDQLESARSQLKQAVQDLGRAVCEQDGSSDAASPRCAEARPLVEKIAAIDEEIKAVQQVAAGAKWGFRRTILYRGLAVAVVVGFCAGGVAMYQKLRDPASASPLARDLDVTSTWESHEEMFARMLNEVEQRLRADESDDTMRKAAFLGDIDTIGSLIAEGVDVEAREGNALTALHLASVAGHESVVRLLLDAGARVDIKARAGVDGVTPLHMAAINGDVDTVEVLLNHEARVDLRDGDGRTPLSWASNMEVFKHLLKHGAHLGQEESPEDLLLVACRNGWIDVVIYVINNGADLNRASSSILSSDARWYLLRWGSTDAARCLLNHGQLEDPLEALLAGTLWEQVESEGRMEAIDLNEMLLAAAAWGRADLAEELIEKGADANHQSRDGCPLHVVLSPGHEVESPLGNCVRRLKPEAVLSTIDVLLEHGADIDATDKQGRNTPLHLAVSNLDDPQIVEFLISRGADVNLWNDRDESPLACARSEAVKGVLRRAGAKE